MAVRSQFAGGERGCPKPRKKKASGNGVEKGTTAGPDADRVA